MKFLLSLALAAVPLFSQLNPTQTARSQATISTAFGDRVLSQIVDGGGWQTSVTLVNLRQTLTSYSITCYGDSGGSQVFPWTGIGVTSVLTGTLVGGGSQEVTTAATASSTTQGWCYVATPTSGSNDIAALAIYSYGPSGQQVAVPATSWFLSNTRNSLILPYDNTNGYNYGVALVDSNTFTYPGQPKDTVNVVIADQSGHLIATDSFQMAPSSHLTFVLADRYRTIANTRGTVTFTITTSTGIPTLAGIGLRATPWLAFTSVGMVEPATY